VAYAGAADTMTDGVHPGPAYQQRLADALSAKILESCTP
jgi:lysophospholipase L1-like esterase